MRYLQRARVLHPLNHAHAVGHGNHFVRAQPQTALCTRSGLPQHAVHHLKQLLNALIQPQVLAALVSTVEDGFNGS